uniref:Uncharacterized protein n=1 Tax=Eutreptiella gymnastica TaxID=73025 RepID=A0A7S4LKF9_9EUGL
MDSKTTNLCGTWGWGCGFTIPSITAMEVPPYVPGDKGVHGCDRAHIEHLFGQLWHRALVRRGGPDELHQSVRVLLHFTQFCIQRQVRASLWTMGPCLASCSDWYKQLILHAR